MRNADGKLAITPGVWMADIRSGCCAVYPKSRENDSPGLAFDQERNIHYAKKGGVFNGMYWDQCAENAPNAAFIAEAGTVTNATNRTPAELAALVRELRDNYRNALATAYASGYGRGHEDTVEGQYNPDYSGERIEEMLADGSLNFTAALLAKSEGV